MAGGVNRRLPVPEQFQYAMGPRQFVPWESDISEAYRDGHAMAGERRLLWAVLEDAWTKVQRGDQEDRKWFFTRDAHWPFAFEVICQHLNLDAEAIRARLPPARLEPRQSVAGSMDRILRFLREHGSATAAEIRTHLYGKKPRGSCEIDADRTYALLSKLRARKVLTVSRRVWSFPGGAA